MIKMLGDKIVGQIEELKNELSLENVKIIPLFATEGDNVTVKSENIISMTANQLLKYLENVDISEENGTGIYLPVQKRVCQTEPHIQRFSRSD